jgi:hypothetical protein
MSTSVSATCPSSTLYALPVIDTYDEAESVVFINPTLVSTLAAEEIEIGEEFPATKTVKGTKIVMSNSDEYLVPFAPAEVAKKLDITLMGLADATNA